MARYRAHIAVTGAYIILSVIFAYPAAFSGKMLSGSDTFWYLWDFWWFKKSLMNFTSPYYTSYVYYPSGVTLTTSDLSPFNAIVSIPLQTVFGLLHAYELVWVSTFILSGLGMFLLARHLTGDSRAAFVAGLIFAFCPYRFAHALEGHVNLMTTQWMPLYALFLIKTVNEKRVSNAVFAALFLALTAISSYYYLLFLFVFTGMYLLYYLVTKRKSFDIGAAKRIALMSAISGLLSLPFLYPLIKDLLNSSLNYAYVSEFTTYSADLLGFFIPSLFHPLFHSYVSPYHANFTGNWSENNVFAGYTVLMISIISIWKWKNMKEIQFWIISGAIFFLLSLGPIAHINGISSYVYAGHVLHIPLPYSALTDIPIFSFFRTPGRWDILLMLSLSVLAGYGTKILLSLPIVSCKKHFRKDATFIVISCLILFEFLAVPVSMSSSEVPPFYKQIAGDRREYAILEVPDVVFTRWQSRTYADYMYYQTVHGKKLVNGYVSREPLWANIFLASTPIVSNLLFFTPTFNLSSHTGKDILNQHAADVGTSIFNYYNINYVVLHKDRLTAEQFEFANGILKEAFNVEPTIYENPSLIVYEVRDEPVKLFSILKDGWYDPENLTGVPFRWMGENASLFVYSPDSRSVTLSLQAVSFYIPRTLEVYVNSQRSASLMVNPIGLTNVKVDLKLNKGDNLIQLQVGGCQRPCDIPELQSGDPRNLGLSVQNITIS